MQRNAAHNHQPPSLAAKKSVLANSPQHKFNMTLVWTRLQELAGLQ